jgi:cysteine desulfurase family protein (TIGR01976 family)
MALDLTAIRQRFPALSRREGDRAAVWLDGPAGTQVPQEVIDATSAVYTTGVSNHGGHFSASEYGEAVTSDARGAVADLLGCQHNEVVFGQNMTSLTFAASRAIAADWRPGDRVIVTALDHDANVTPWVRAAAERGAAIVRVPFDSTTGLLDPQRVIDEIDDQTRLIAVAAASNALGSVTDLAPIIKAADEHGALTYVDAVHFSAHRLSDVTDLGCDFLVASAYKFFGPHTGIMYAKAAHLARLSPYKVVPAPEEGPERWETGTQSFESLAGVTAAIDYLASLGDGGTRRQRLESAFDRIAAHEDELSRRFLAGLAEMPSISLFGPPRADRSRVSTFSIELDGLPAERVAAALGARGIYVWDGHYYAVGVMEQLGKLDGGGLVRIGFVHYTTTDEVDRLLSVLEEITATG